METKHAGYMVMRKNNWLHQRWMSLYHGTHTAVNPEVLVPFTVYYVMRHQGVISVFCSDVTEGAGLSSQKLVGYIHCAE